jgi:hypothetical protein
MMLKFTTINDWPTQEKMIYGIQQFIREKVLLDYALKSYQIASDLESPSIILISKGLLYGQLGIRK